MHVFQNLILDLTQTVSKWQSERDGILHDFEKFHEDSNLKISTLKTANENLADSIKRSWKVKYTIQINKYR